MGADQSRWALVLATADFHKWVLYCSEQDIREVMVYRYLFLPVLLFQSYQFSRFVSFSSVVIRVANHRYNFFIAIIDKIFKIIAILSVIGDNFGKARNNIAEIISVLLCEYLSRYTLIFCTLHSSMAAFFVEDVSIEQMKGL